MKLLRDHIVLDEEFPFQISRILLNESNSQPDTCHWHSYFEITCVESGSGEYFVNGQVYSMKKGDIIIFNNVEAHGWKLSGEKMHLLVLVFAPEFVSERMSNMEAGYLKPFVERGSDFQNRIGVEDNVSEEIRKSLYEIYSEWEGKREGYHLMIKADVLRILTMLNRVGRNKGASREMLTDKKNAMKRLEQAFAYIDEHFCEKIALEQAAAAAYMSTSYFSTYFRKVSGVNFIEYVTKMRVMRAAELLKSTDKTVNEIALECGFHNLSNFYRMYKKYTGKAPREE